LRGLRSSQWWSSSPTSVPLQSDRKVRQRTRNSSCVSFHSCMLVVFRLLVYSCFLGRATTFCFEDNTFLQSTKYITVIRDMCDNVVTSVRTCDSESGTFLIIRYDYIYIKDQP
jgi:hypothetical protein